MHELAHEFTSRRISPWGGMKFFQQTYERSGMRESLLAAGLPENASNNSHKAIDLVEGFMVGAVLGAKRMAHTAMLRHDEVLSEMFNWEKGMGSQSAFSRYFRKFTVEDSDRVFTGVMRSWWDQLHIQKITLDMDSSILERYGKKQQGAVKGYNPKNPGGVSHRPLMAFCDELKMVVNAWMRPGNASETGDASIFLKHLLKVTPAHRIGLMRCDAGFYSGEFMDTLEDEKVPYMIRGKLTSPLLNRIVRIKEWYSDDSVFQGAQYAEIQYKSTEWRQARRMVVVRRPRREKNPQQLLLGDEVMHKQYEIGVFATSTNLSASKVHKLYNQRGECENRIKELKYDYGIDGFAFKDIAAVDATFRLVMLAFNIMALFKQKCLTHSRSRQQLATIRFQCIAVGSYLVKKGRNKVLKLSAEGKRRHFLEYFFDQVELLQPPFKFSTA